MDQTEEAIRLTQTDAAEDRSDVPTVFDESPRGCQREVEIGDVEDQLMNGKGEHTQMQGIRYSEASVFCLIWCPHGCLIWCFFFLKKKRFLFSLFSFLFSLFSFSFLSEVAELISTTLRKMQRLRVPGPLGTRAEHWYDCGSLAGDSNLFVQSGCTHSSGSSSPFSASVPEGWPDHTTGQTHTGGHRPLLMMSFLRRLALK